MALAVEDFAHQAGTLNQQSLESHWIETPQEQKTIEEQVGYDQEEFLYRYSASAVKKKRSTPGESILLIDGTDKGLDERVLRLRFFSWLAREKLSDGDKAVAIECEDQQCS
jgi:hypothetical protein